MHFLALLTSDDRRRDELLSTKEAKALTSILVSGRVGIWKLGNDDQNEAGAGDE